MTELDPAPTVPTVLATVPAGNGPWGMAVDSNLGLWVADNTGSGASEIDTNTATPASPQPLVSLGGSPYGAAYDPGHKALWFSDNGSNDVVEVTPGNTAAGPAGLRKSTYLGNCETVYYQDINGSGVCDKPVHACTYAGASG